MLVLMSMFLLHTSLFSFLLLIQWRFLKKRFQVKNKLLRNLLWATAFKPISQKLFKWDQFVIIFYLWRTCTISSDHITPYAMWSNTSSRTYISFLFCSLSNRNPNSTAIVIIKHVQMLYNFQFALMGRFDRIYRVILIANFMSKSQTGHHHAAKSNITTRNIV